MKKLIFIILVGLAFGSCDKWFNGLEIELDLPEHDPILAVYSYVNAGDELLTFRVGKSVGVLANENPELIDSATIQLYKNGLLELELQSSPILVVDTPYIYTDPDTTIYFIDSFYVYGQPLDMPFADTPDEYELVVTSPGYPDVRATQVMPRKAEILGATNEIGGYNGGDFFGEDLDEVRLTIKDPAGEENFYAISVEYLDTSQGQNIWYDTWLQSIDPAAEEGNEGPIFSDLSFDGEQYTFRIGVWINDFPSGNNPNITKFRIKVVSITKDYYTFSRSLNQYWNANGNPFAEPVLLYSNFENGLGLFSLQQSTSIEIDR